MSTTKSEHNVAYVLYVCLVAAFGGLLLGFDSSVISGAIEPLSQHYQLTASEKGWAVSNVIIGCIIGCFTAGSLADKYGRKIALIITALLFAVSALGSAIATDFTVFVIFRMIGGLAIGTACVVSPVYIAEVAPKDMRGRASTMNLVCLVGGQLLVLISNYLIARGATDLWLADMGWRWMLGSELIPCVLFLLLIGFIPESPRWNVMKNRDESALKTLTRISNESHALELLKQIKESVRSTIQEENQPKEKVKFTKRTVIFLVIGVGLATFNQLTGINVIQYFGPTLLMNVTDSVQEAMFMSIFLVGLQFAGVIVGLQLIDTLGRRPLLLWGSVGTAICLLITFVTFFMGVKGFASVIGLLGFMFIFGITWAQVIWAVISEIFPNHLRAVGTGFSISAMWISSFVISQTFPMLNESSWLVDRFHGGFPLLVFAVGGAISWWFVKAYVPETKGIPLEEMEDLVLKHNASRKDHHAAKVVQ
ncbi:sugar porter family MFS transporter [Vibrio viridaestus]|uniref:D-xylose-proton symporter n=1 Tax=Vibrio viridaestus TaxID=2487322 RepID=A0A3N9TKN5_9VIBR|nr:sugar porter family MFS transporter [Vibrio viridaestus]RQW64837.1 MFS transporter [Vibrio viridaestus]